MRFNLAYELTIPPQVSSDDCVTSNGLIDLKQYRALKAIDREGEGHTCPIPARQGETGAFDRSGSVRIEWLLSAP